MRLQKMVPRLVKDEVPSHLDEIEDGSGAIQDHVPTVLDSHVLSSFGQGIVRPVFYIRPIPREILSIYAEQIFGTGIETPEPIDVDPLPKGLVSATDADEQVGAVGIVIVITILAQLWCDQGIRR